MTECLPGRHEAPGSIPSAAQTKSNQTNTEAPTPPTQRNSHISLRTERVMLQVTLQKAK